MLWFVHATGYTDDDVLVIAEPTASAWLKIVQRRHNDVSSVQKKIKRAKKISHSKKKPSDVKQIILGTIKWKLYGWTLKFRKVVGNRFNDDKHSN